jgi:Putative transmembrane protein (PGPGW)
MTSAASQAGRLVGSALGTARVGAGKARRSIRKNSTANTLYRTAVGVTGGATIALGVALIPLPGPGSLVALGGLAMLGTEFEGARKVNQKATELVKKGYESTRGLRGAAKRSTPAESAASKPEAPVE